MVTVCFSYDIRGIRGVRVPITLPRARYTEAQLTCLAGLLSNSDVDPARPMLWITVGRRPTFADCDLKDVDVMSVDEAPLKLAGPAEGGGNVDARTTRSINVTLSYSEVGDISVRLKGSTPRANWRTSPRSCIQRRPPWARLTSALA